MIMMFLLAKGRGSTFLPPTRASRDASQGTCTCQKPSLEYLTMIVTRILMMTMMIMIRMMTMMMIRMVIRTMMMFLLSGS